MDMMYSFDAMKEKPDALERLDLRFRWGDYEIRVLRWHLTSFAPGHLIRYHKHSEFEFHYIPRGKGSVILEDQPFKLNSGMLYLTGPGVVHQQTADRRDGMDELCLHIDIRPLPTDAAAHSSETDWERKEAEVCIQILWNYPLQPFLDHHEAMPYFLEAYHAARSGSIGAYTTIKQALIQILIRTARAAADSKLTPFLPSRDIQAHRFKIAMQHIRDNYANPLTLREIADRVQLSNRQLQRLLRKYGIDSFSQYLETVRLKRICEDLTKTMDNIETIAQRHGYFNSNYLYPVFKRKFSMTPQEYRQSYMKTATRPS